MKIDERSSMRSPTLRQSQLPLDDSISLWVRYNTDAVEASRAPIDITSTAFLKFYLPTLGPACTLFVSQVVVPGLANMSRYADELHLDVANAMARIGLHKGQIRKVVPRLRQFRIAETWVDGDRVEMEFFHWLPEPGRTSQQRWPTDLRDELVEHVARMAEAQRLVEEVHG